MRIAENQPHWAGRIARHQIERLYERESRGILDDELIDEVGYGLFARCESILAFTHSHRGTATCPGCLETMGKDGETVSCSTCNWSTTEEGFLKSSRKKYLHAGRLEPFIEAFVEDFKKAKGARAKLLLIDILIHRCHGDYEGSEGLRAGAINLIGGKPREVMAFLDRLGGIRRSGLDSEADHGAWVARVKQERPGGWR